MDYSYLYDLKKASKIVGLSASYIRQSIKQKKLTAKKIGNKFMIHREELDRFARDLVGLETSIIQGTNDLLKKWALSSSKAV